MEYLLKGVLIGLLFGLPVGAVGTMTVQRTWRSGLRAGLITGLGSSVADCLYAAGAFSLTWITGFLLRYQAVVNLLGGGFILFMGIRMLLKREEPAGTEQRAYGGARMFLSAFAVGITNPAAILAFLFAFSYFGISDMAGPPDGLLLVCGVFLGTYLWWGALSAAACAMKRRAGSFRHMNQVFGGLLSVFGAAVFLRLFL